MTKKKDNAILVTEFAQFYRATSNDETRHYPVNAANKLVANEFNGGDIAPMVNGFAVYDTTVSTDYAVAIYGDKAAADAHKGTPAPKAPTSPFKEPTDAVSEPYATASDVPSGKNPKSKKGFNRRNK